MHFSREPGYWEQRIRIEMRWSTTYINPIQVDVQDDNRVRFLIVYSKLVILPV